MGRKILLTGLIIVSVCGVSALPASASTPKPTIKTFSPKSATVGTEVMVTGTNLKGATKVTFNGKTAKVISGTAKKVTAYVPAGASTGYIKVKTPGGTATSVSKFTVLTPLDDTMSVVSEEGGYCALLTSSGVDCWGDSDLGNGSFSSSATPAAVEGIGGTGTLTGVTSLVSDSAGYCALLTSGEVDCWGYGYDGELGNGTFYTSGNEGSATPVAVEGVGGTGRLTGVTSLVSDSSGYCALLTSGGVDCWGFVEFGELGNGTFYMNNPSYGSAIPVAVEGVGGTGRLTGVTSVVSGSSADGYCALLTSGTVDCWGFGEEGQLGNGKFNDAATPVAVKGVGGSGTLTGVTTVVGANSTYCALLASGAADCWGDGYYGQLGNGKFYTTGDVGSATPVKVKGVGGTGTLTRVTSLVSDQTSYSAAASYCALLSSGGADCWGEGSDGVLGNGTFYGSPDYGSATPVVVESVGGNGTLTGVTSLFGDGDGFCALLTSIGVDCWGDGYYGQLGNGTFYTSEPYGSAAPVAVEGVGGTGTLTGVSNLVGGWEGYCALLTSGRVDCWGFGLYGELGNGSFYKTGNAAGSATPVEVG